MYLTVKQVIERLNGTVGKSLVYKLIESGKLPSTRVGGKILVRTADLDAYLDAQTNNKKPPQPRGRSGTIVDGVELW